MGAKTIDDVLLSRYIGELSASYSITRLTERSPYQLPLKHTNVIASSFGQRCYSVRNVASNRDNTGKCDSHRSKSSDPADRNNDSARPGDNKNEDRDPDKCSARSDDRKRLQRPRTSVPSYLQIPEMYVVTAFRNGDRGTSVRVSAVSFEKLLEQCTIKLGLPSSARKLFLKSGKEVSRSAVLPRGTEVYASMGESFRDPARVLEKRLNLGADVQWTLNGINLPSDREKEVTKQTPISQRLSNIPIKRRILIFSNGKGLSGIEIVANMSNIEELKYNCTLKLNHGQHIKRLLLMNGAEVKDIQDVPEIDPLLNSSVGTPLLGPVWASKGENISPMGVEEYLRDVIRFVEEKKKKSKGYTKQLELVRDSDDRESLAKDPNLTNKKILSMSADELTAEIKKEKQKQKKYNAFLKEHKQLLSDVEPEARVELEEGSKFTMKHISALPENHSLVSGRAGLRVKAFMNGKDSDPIKVHFNIHEASRGLKKYKNRKEIVLQRFLDCLSANPLLESKNSKSKGILVRRLFTKAGSEITDAFTLQQEQEIWISHGEDWIDPFTYCLQAEISKVTELIKSDGTRLAVVRSELSKVDEKSSWKVKTEVPVGIERRHLPPPEVKQKESDDKANRDKSRGRNKKVRSRASLDDYSFEEQFEDDDKEEEEEKEEEEQEKSEEWLREEDTKEEEQKPPPESVSSHSCFLQNSKNKQFCLFAEPVVGTQRAPEEVKSTNEGDTIVKHVWRTWPKSGIAQNWIVHKTGQISLKNFKLALSACDDSIETNVQNVSLRGHIVQFSLFEDDEDQVPLAQKWRFNSDGLIYSEKFPHLVLTYPGGLVDDPQSRPKIQGDNDNGYRNMLIVSEPLATRDDLNSKQKSQLEKHQRFGLRLSKFENFSTWRKAGDSDENGKSEKHKDPSWSKLALLWPTDKKGNRIEDLDWPLECYMLAYAPPLTEHKSESDNPKRFFCMKNGERNSQFGTFVTAPNMANMKKQKKQQKKQSKGKKKHQHQDADGRTDADSVNGDDYLHVPHCSDMTIRKLEFKIFLEFCTSVLGLSSAARRIFDDKGVEYDSIENLERDQILYVSVGEPWTDPKYSKKQLEARSMLVKIAEDVDKIRSFIALKNTASLVIAAESLTAGASLGVSRDVLSKRERREKQLRETQSPPDAIFDSSGDDEDEKIDPEIGLSAHDRACRSGDARLSNLKWPWERIVSNEPDQAAVENREEQAPAKVSAQKQYRNKDLNLKQFVLKDGFIFAKENEDLVFTATDSGGSRVLDVTLQKRRPDNVFQRWSLTSIGQIALKYQSSSVLTVKLPKVAVFSSEPVNIESSVLTVQPMKPYQFGRAHQLFALDEDRLTIRCFATNSLDIAVTAANQSGCCTYYVTTKGEKLDQPGYIVYLPVGGKAESKMRACNVCVSCAKSLRGKYKLQKVVPGSKTDFSCAFGQSIELGLKERGSFKILNYNIDLTDSEAPATLSRWENEIQLQRENLSVKAISNRLADGKTPRPIRVLAYRNGEGRLCKPVAIYGTSVQGIMEQCMSKLSVSWAIRKLFLADGTPVLDFEDLRRWCEAHSKQMRKRQKEIDSGRLQPEMDEIRAELAEADTSPPAQQSDTDQGRTLKAPSRRDELEPRLKERYFVIGSHLKDPTGYTLIVSLYGLNFLDQILTPVQLAAGETQMLVRYTIFGQTISTDPFTSEETFEGERREIQIKSELPILRRFFNEKLRLLKFDLVRLPEDTVLATSYVPMDTLVREEHEELINSTKIGADYAWYKKSTEKPKGERTQASLHVEISVTLSIDVNVDNNDDEDSASASGTSNEGATDQLQSGAIRKGRESPRERAGAEDQKSTSETSSEPLDLQDLCIELWASQGEAFVPLRVAHQEFREMLKQRKELRKVLNAKDADKHILKMMQGRRLQGQEPGKYRSTTDPEHPVVVEGGWKTPRGEEIMVEQEISDLQDKEAKIRAKHVTAKPSSKGQVAFNFDRQLYKQTSMLRLQVFLNGEDPKTATTIWAENIHQVLDNATMRLGLQKQAKILYDLNGKDVHDFSQLSRDQMLCVSKGEAYKPPGAVFESVEIKANWGRAKRMHGPKSTNFQVQARGHPLVGVDPFGPPLHGSAAKSLPPPPPPTFDTKRARVFENGRTIGEPASIFGDSLEALLKAATLQLKLHSPAICFYNEEGHQIVSFNEISRDDLLFASTTKKQFIRTERR